MKNLAILSLIIISTLTAFAQKPKTAKKPATAAPKTKTVKPTVNVGNEKEEFEKAVATVNALERIEALQKFIKNFPKSADKNRALELIVSARAQIGDEKLSLNETAEGVEFFKLAVKDAPQPMSEKIFSDLIVNFPTNLFWRGQRTEALEIARMIEAKADGNAKQLLGLASFYLGTENASEAKRIAEKAIALDAKMPAAYQTLGLAHRLNFQLEESANAYAKALELAADSVVSKRSLAEMKRATNKPDEAAALYREILEKDTADISAQTGLILSLFGAEKRTEAEAEMSRAFEVNPNNLVLLVGAAYWYAAHNEGVKAVELAQKAAAIEPRYTWAHIALARGFLQQKRPLDAERALLEARQYGNFPTLDYEIASARLQAGFFREAADILKTNFTISGDNIRTNLGGRVTKEAANFTDLLALERRASIFEPTAADTEDNANKLKSLLNFSNKLDSANEDEIAVAADEFVQGGDKMNVHRGLFAANLLMQNRKALPKALELAQSAVGKADAALDVPNASAAVLADELYESRTISMSRNQFVVVPEVPRQTLSAILRGRIEEITGWTFYQQNKPAEAAIRLKRAVSVLPEKSAWWRSSMWRLGAALEADGKQKDALNSYIKSYPNDAPDSLKYSIIESLYKKLNGNTDGLEAKIGAKPASPIIALDEPEKVETVAQNTETANKTAETTVTPEAIPTPEVVPTPEIKTEPTPEVIATPEIKVEPTPETISTPEVKPEPTPEVVPTPAVEATPEATPENPPIEVKTPEITEAKPEPTPAIAPTPETVPEIKPEPTPQVSPVPTTEAAPELPVQTEQNSETAPENPPTETTETKVDSPEKPKPLFEPVIILIPKREPLKNPNPKNTDTNQPDESAEKPVDESVGSGIVRVRVIDENSPCSLVVSQENVSLLNGGGSLGILVGFEKSAISKEITAFSSSRKDVEVTFEPEIGALSGRAFFIVKSVSTKVGEYKVTFEASCGKKEITVNVR
jgi:tetratricopeptide (TPR) repeat protein